MAQSRKSLVEEVLEDAQQVRETALANAKLALSEAFEPRIKSMISRHLQTEMEDEDEMEEMYGEDEMEEADEDEMEEADEDGVVADPTNADDASIAEEDEEEIEEEEYSDDEMEEEYEEDELDLESVIAELEAEMDDEMGEEDEEEESEMDIEDEMGMEDEEEEEDEEIIDLEELLSSLSEEEEEEVTEEEDEDESELEMENRKLTSELTEHREAIKILRDKLHEVNLLNAKLLYTTKLFRNYTLSNSQKMKVVESFDRTKSVRETKLVYSTLAESLNIAGGSTRKTRTASITEGFASKPTTSTKPKATIISEGNDLTNRFKRLVSYNK